MFRCFLLSLFLLPTLGSALELRVSGELLLTQALSQIREARKAAPEEPALILLPESVTELLQPITLNAEDSNFTIIGTKSTLIGGPTVTGW
ncbi:MAG: hypothetical protein NTV80_16125, partial [Verrucomicrobia bacterium]|nr:hypothetical protein [Verrucomicrobiota bacterium]